MNFSKKVSHYEGSDDEYSYNSNGSFVSGEMDSDDDTEFQPSTKRTRTITNVSMAAEKNSIKRKPTRVPNLKIQNRNALLARENRKRKKEMMDSLEKTVDDLQSQNKKLHKMMKFKDARTLKLEQEVRYLKSVIANKTEIVSVLKSLPKFTGSCPEIKKEAKEFKSTGSGSDTATCETFDDNGSVILEDLFMPTITDDFIFPDLDVATEWDEILRNPFSSTTDFSDIPKLEEINLLSPASSPTSEISTEHNYFEKSSLMSSDMGGAGVCVHINSGRVSLEFCSTCHYNATNSWIASN